jgi:glycerophosphoryl diester phosphodiesterase
MLILSHRGFHQHCPENTLDAFAAAIALGVDGIETDVQVSADGIPILFHDRIAPNHQAVNQLTQAQLSELMGYPIPQLQDALALPRPNPNFLWNIELKSPEALATSLDLLSDYGDRHPLLVTSFWHPLIAKVAAQTTLQTGLLIAHHPYRLAVETQWIQKFPTLKTLVCSWNCMGPVLVQQCAALGLKLFVYSPLTQTDHQTLRDLGVDGVISDRPDWLLN